MATDTDSATATSSDGIRFGQDRLRQPWPDIGFPLAPRRPKPIHRQVGHDSREIGLRIGNLRAVGARPLEPGILDDVLGVCGGAQQPIRDGEQQLSMLGEGLLVGGHRLVPPAPRRLGQATQR